jgi:hypothetical protein
MAGRIFFNHEGEKVKQRVKKKTIVELCRDRSETCLYYSKTLLPPDLMDPGFFESHDM